MSSRYAKTKILINDADSYKEILNEKDLQFIKQYSLKPFTITRENIGGLSSISYTVKPFDKLYNISQTVYGFPQYGWVILSSNFLTSELDIEEGMILSVYYPLNALLGI